MFGANERRSKRMLVNVFVHDMVGIGKRLCWVGGICWTESMVHCTYPRYHRDQYVRNMGYQYCVMTEDFAIAVGYDCFPVFCFQWRDSFLCIKDLGLGQIGRTPKADS